MNKKPSKKTSVKRRVTPSAESIAKLKQTIAAQAREIREGAEQQAATREILRVIASSPTDIQPVLDAIADSAARLCDAPSAIVYRVDGTIMRRAAVCGRSVPDAVFVGEELPVERNRIAGRAIVDRQKCRGFQAPRRWHPACVP